jgi:cystine transport system substrate-binding protein
MRVRYRALAAAAAALAGLVVAAGCGSSGSQGGSSQSSTSQSSAAQSSSAQSSAAQSSAAQSSSSQSSAAQSSASQATSASSASSQAGPSQAGDISGLLKAGTLVVGTSGSYPPFTFVDDSGNLTGYDVDISKEIAKRLGLKADIQAVDFNALLAGLSAGKYDAVASAISLEDDKSTSYQLSDPELTDGITLLVKADSSIKSIKDIDGRKLGGPAGTAAFDTIKKAVSGNWQVVTFPGMTEAVQGLKDGRVDALAVTHTVGAYTVKSDSSLRVLDEIVGKFHSCLAVSNKGGKPMLDAINKEIAAMISDGTVAKLQEKYFGVVALP